MITPETKDKLLQLLHDNLGDGCLYEIGMDDIMKELGLSSCELQSLLEEFQSIHLIEELNMRRETFFLCVSHNARVFLEKGGFQRQASIESLAYANLQLQYQTLQAELESLKQTNPTLAERIASFLANVATIAGIRLT